MFEMILNEDCMETMKKLRTQSIDIVLTSPPYNTGQPSTSERSRRNHQGRYDIHLDTKSPDEFIEWCIQIFNEFDRILKKDAVVLWNMSYGNNVTTSKNGVGLMWRLIGHICEETSFTVADEIIWKKRSTALPDNASTNKLTRWCEHVFVFARQSEYKTFHCNKEVSKIGVTGQTFYKPIFNFIEAANNDGSNPLNKATYSTELCDKLLRIYAPLDENTIVYDPFMGTGTTAVACKKLGIGYLGSEISPAQCEYAKDRIENTMSVGV